MLSFSGPNARSLNLPVAFKALVTQINILNDMEMQLIHSKSSSSSCKKILIGSKNQMNM